MATNPPFDELAGKLRRTEIQHSASSIPGREIVQVLTGIPAGVESGWHMHPGEEVGYVLVGTVEIRIESKPTLTLHADQGFLRCATAVTEGATVINWAPMSACQRRWPILRPRRRQ